MFSNNRREFLKRTTKVIATIPFIRKIKFPGLFQVDPKRDQRVQSTLKENVYFPHPIGNTRRNQRLNSYERSGNPTDLFTDELDRKYRSGTENSINIHIFTEGEKIKRTSSKYERSLHGWRPTEGEVEKLREFGEIAYSSGLTSTRVTLMDVSPNELINIADLPFVQSVTIADSSEGMIVGANCPKEKNDGAPMENVRQYNHTNFDLAMNYADLSTSIRAGFIDSGYSMDEQEHDASSEYDSQHAKDFGMAHNSHDFVTEDSFNWIYDKEGHGTGVADTFAYMLDPDDEHYGDNIAILRITDATLGIAEINSNIREAIEYAIEEDIEVINIAHGGSYSNHYNEFCDELKAYAMCGYIPVAAVGNQGNDNMRFAGSSHWTIGVGGYDPINPCESGVFAEYNKDECSSFGTTISYSECDTCYERSSGNPVFHPTVYGCYSIETDKPDYASGTSNSAPQVAAAAMLMQNNGLFDFDKAEQIFESMNLIEICDEFNYAKRGEVLNAYEAYDETV